MRLVIQRVRRASVEVEGREVASIGLGLVALAGFSADESPSHDLARMAHRIINLRIFEDEAGRMNRSLKDVGGAVLLVPQITLSASLRRGTRPSFHTAATPEQAGRWFEEFAQTLQAVWQDVRIGVFGARMLVRVENDGPVTFILDDPPLSAGQS